MSTRAIKEKALIPPRVKVYSLSILLALGVGGASAFLTMGNMDIYKEISKPPLSPPSILFPIVWTALYILMGISAAMIYEKRGDNLRGSENALYIYLGSLAVNFTWSIIFFNFQSFILAFFWLLLLIYLIVRTILSYRKIKPLAAYLQIPYLLWSSFAAYLNFAIFLLN